ncbi:MFS transporter [Desertihabitans brevis]|nr:MFS transporter [Desertihabitans brevis]
MATWEDGPEYAPHQRPDQFQPPADAPSLGAAPPAPRPSASEPLAPPLRYEMRAQVAGLETLVPDRGEQRDPHRAFDVVQSVMTEQPSSGPRAWSAAHSSSWSQQWAPPPGTPAPAAPAPVVGGHDPQQPFAVGQGMRPGQPQLPPPAGPAHPAPGTDQWFAPTSWEPPEAHGDFRSTGTRVVQGVTWPVLIVLGLGVLIFPLSLFCVVGAAVLTNWVPRRRSQARVGYAIGFGVLALVGLVGFLDTLSFSGLVTAVQPMATLFCLAMLVVHPVLSYLSVQAGEPEERGPYATRNPSAWG